jgi:hypothetical protein
VGKIQVRGSEGQVDGVPRPFCYDDLPVNDCLPILEMPPSMPVACQRTFHLLRWSPAVTAKFARAQMPSSSWLPSF